MTELLQELIEFLREASPMVWEAMVRQVYVEAAQNAIWTIASIVLMVWGYLTYMRGYTMHEEDEESDGEWIQFIGGLILALGFVFTIITGFEAVVRLVNPNYYAIKLILEQLGGM